VADQHPSKREVLRRAVTRPETYTGTLRELTSAAACVVRYPLGILEGAIRAGRPCGQAELDTPVLLVHGYGHNRSGWTALSRALRCAGFTSVHTWNYNPLRHDVPTLAAQLGERVELLRAITGSEKVHVVGHSLGGVLLRWYVQELGGDQTVDTAITIASPHEGTELASLVFGPRSRTIRQIAPGSAIMRRLASGARATPVRWIAYYSNLDGLVMPATSAKISAPELRAVNVFVKDQGHLSILLAPAVTGSITEQLLAAEGAAGLSPVAPFEPGASEPGEPQRPPRASASA
jgi:triacylglycerol esterase/lipase EstA (alpha/beta hydrolase family)